MTDDTLYAITAKLSVGSYRLGDLGYLIAIGTDISGEVVLEGTHMTTVTDIQFNTLILHLTGIDPLTGSLTHQTDTRHVDEDVGGLLEVPLKRSVEGVTEESEVKTEVCLGGRLPLQVIVTQLVTLESTRQGMTAIRSLDIITRTIALTAEASLTVITLIDGVTGNVADLLVTCLSP